MCEQSGGKKWAGRRGSLGMGVGLEQSGAKHTGGRGGKEGLHVAASKGRRIKDRNSSLRN